jgi:hypothetical protein
MGVQSSAWVHLQAFSIAPRRLKSVPASLLYLGVLCSPGLAHADICTDWFGQTGATPGTPECMSICTSADVNLSTYECPAQCPDFCSGPGPKQRFTKDQKDSLSSASAALNTQAGFEATIAIGCGFLPDPTVSKVCTVGLGLTSGASWALSGLLGQLALDPPDSNFTVVPLPVTPSYTAATVTPPFNQTAANSINTLAQNQAQASGLSQAILIAINRASGAVAASDSGSENMQVMVASQYSIELANLLNAEPGLMSSVSSALTGAGFPITQVTVQDVQNFQASVAASGLPAPIVQVLQQFGADQTAINAIVQQVASLDPAAVAGTLAAGFTSANVTSTVQNAAQALNSMATGNNVVPLTPGHSVAGTLRFKTASGDNVKVYISARVSNWSKKLTGTFTLNSTSSTNPQQVKGGKILNASLQGGNVIVDGSYTASNGAASTFTAVASAKGGSATINQVNVSLSSGYSASGAVTSGGLTIR